MDIHKPKPWHGLREFLKEYVIIVIGVLTALGAEQGVEWLHWRHQTELAHQALAYDMKRVMGWAGLLDVQGPCLGARLNGLDAVLDKAQETGRLPPLGPLAKPIEGTWNLRSWTGLTYGQTLAHMPNAEQTRLAGLARDVDWMFSSGHEEYDDWSRLQRMSGPGRRTNDAEIAALRETIASERGRGRAEARRGSAGGNLRHRERPAPQKRDREGLAAGRRRRWQGFDLWTDPADLQARPVGANLREPAWRPSEATRDDVGVRGESLK